MGSGVAGGGGLGSNLRCSPHTHAATRSIVSDLSHRGTFGIPTRPSP